MQLQNKKIIIIGKREILPYLTLGLSKYSSNIKIISSSELDENIFRQVELYINNYVI